jgi:hypothetical protein
VGQRHGAGSQVEQAAQIGQRVLDAVAPLDGDQRGDPTFRPDAVHVGGVEGDREGLGIPAHQLADELDLLDGGLEGQPLPAHLHGHVDRPELRVHVALPEPGNVGSEAGHARSEIDGLEPTGAGAPHLPGEVVVAVEHERLGVDPPRLVADDHERPLISDGQATEERYPGDDETPGRHPAVG